MQLFSFNSYRTRFFIALFSIAAFVLLSATISLNNNLSYRVKAGNAAFSLAVGRHVLHQNGQDIAYRSATGYIAINDRQHKPLANIFYTSYDVEQSNTTNPTVTFVFNGGPGSASIWLHMGAFGPVRVNTTQGGYSDNPYSWLGFTDLVFIDPVGTGYSKPADGVDIRKFYDYSQDISSIAEFIKVYLSQRHRSESPKFIAGESYGAVRAVGLAAYLQDSLQIKLAGLTLISPVLNYKLVSFRPGNDEPYAYYLPTYALAAQYHQRLAPEVQELSTEKLTQRVTAFSNGTYAKFLKDGGPASETIIDSLSYYTGSSRELLGKLNGRIADKQFTKTLLATSKRVTGTFDSRVVGEDVTSDPSETAIRGAFTRSYDQYVRNDLGYQNNLPYLATTAVGSWNYGPHTINGYLDVSKLLEQLIIKDPDLKVKVAAGYYDLATPVATINKVISNLKLSTQQKQNISVDHYKAGHMIYLSDEANARFKINGEQFYKQTLSVSRS